MYKISLYLLKGRVEELLFLLLLKQKTILNEYKRKKLCVESYLCGNVVYIFALYLTLKECPAIYLVYFFLTIHTQIWIK